MFKLIVLENVKYDLVRRKYKVYTCSTYVKSINAWVWICEEPPENIRYREVVIDLRTLLNIVNELSQSLTKSLTSPQTKVKYKNIHLFLARLMQNIVKYL